MQNSSKTDKNIKITDYQIKRKKLKQSCISGSHAGDPSQTTQPDAIISTIRRFAANDNIRDPEKMNRPPDNPSTRTSVELSEAISTRNSRERITILPTSY